MDKASKVFSRICTKRNVCLFGVVLPVVVVAIAYFNRSGHIPPGRYVAERGIVMVVDDDSVRIVRDKSTVYTLPNKTKRIVYSEDDLVQFKPQRLFLTDSNTVEWIRESAGGSPRYEMSFKMDEGERRAATVIKPEN